jgi:hypothetical protein
MNSQEALQYFEIDADYQQMELLDVMDERLFQIKNEVLQKIQVPSLLSKRKKECDKIIEALEALNMKEDVTLPEFPKPELPKEKIAFLENYESLLASTKLVIFNARNPQTLSLAIDFIINLQHNYNHNFEEVFAEYGKSDNSNISVTQHFESGVVIRALKNNEVNVEIRQLIADEGARISKLLSLG